MGYPGVQLTLGWVMRDRLKDANSQAILGAIEVEYIFTRQTALLLLPLKQFFDFCVLNHSHALVVVEKPLNYVRQ